MNRLRELHEAATPGPWLLDTDSDVAYEDGPIVTWPSGLTAGGKAIAEFAEISQPDAALIVYLRNNAEAICDLIDAAELELHTRECDKPLFDTYGAGQRCEPCAALHDANCHRKPVDKAHESRWCDGNPHDIAVKRTRRALAALRSDSATEDER